MNYEVAIKPYLKGTENVKLSRSRWKTTDAILTSK